MKRKNGEFPYDEYYIYKTFHKNEGRNYAVLVPKDKFSNLKRTTISYARYLMSVKEGRILESWEQVDHLDNDKSNDDIDNLQILTIKENNIKEAKCKGRKYVLLKCPWCRMYFEARHKNTHLCKGGLTTSCSRKCALKFYHMIKKNPYSEEVKNRIINNVIKEYIRHDYKIE